MERDQQLAARGFYREADHALLGRHRFEGLPMQLSATPWDIEKAGPLLGEHTDEVLNELLGYTADEIARLRSEAAI